MLIKVICPFCKTDKVIVTEYSELICKNNDCNEKGKVLLWQDAIELFTAVIEVDLK